MDKERLKQGVISAAPYAAASLVQVPYIFGDNGWINGIFFLSAAYLTYANYKKGIRKYDFHQLTQTDFYQEYVGLYKEFVDDICKMYKELNVSKGMETLHAYKICQENGIFSATGTDQYTTYENDKDLFIQSLGGRVTTGRHCCRHNASLFSDISNNMGGLSPKISVYLDAKPNKKLIFGPNHLVSGLIHNNKRLVVDPTSKLNEFYTDGLCFYKGEKALFRDVLENGFGAKYTIVSAGYDNGALYNDNYDEFMKFPAIENPNELFDDYLEALLTATNLLPDFRDFHEEEKPKILQLSHLSEIVAPHGKAEEKKDKS